MVQCIEDSTESKQVKLGWKAAEFDRYFNEKKLLRKHQQLGIVNLRTSRVSVLLKKSVFHYVKRKKRQVLQNISNKFK